MEKKSDVFNRITEKQSLGVSIGALFPLPTE